VRNQYFFLPFRPDCIGDRLACPRHCKGRRMKWFEHRTDAHGNKKIRKIEIFYKERGDQAVMAAIGRFWRLHEIVGTQGQGDDGLKTPSLFPMITALMSWQMIYIARRMSWWSFSTS
jgi:hypothetical protein